MLYGCVEHLWQKKGEVQEHGWVWELSKMLNRRWCIPVESEQGCYHWWWATFHYIPFRPANTGIESVPDQLWGNQRRVEQQESRCSMHGTKGTKPMKNEIMGNVVGCRNSYWKFHWVVCLQLLWNDVVQFNALQHFPIDMCLLLHFLQTILHLIDTCCVVTPGNKVVGKNNTNSNNKGVNACW